MTEKALFRRTSAAQGAEFLKRVARKPQLITLPNCFEDYVRRTVMRHLWVAVLVTVSHTNAYATDTLPLEWNAVPDAIQTAAEKVGFQTTLNAEPCVADQVTCTWKAEGGVNLSVTTNPGAAKAFQIEANWDGSSPDSESTSPTIFHHFCKAIVAVIHPAWSDAKISSMAQRMILSQPAKPGASKTAETKERDFVFYGERNVPSDSTSSRDAYISCGVTANN